MPTGARVSDRAVAAAYAGALAFVASYAVQRGLGWWLAADSGAIATAHVAFDWRCALAALHAGIAALFMGVGSRDPSAWLQRSWVVWAVVIPSAAALAVFQ